MRHITGDGLDLIKRFEGFRPTIYICPADWPTIGYGHVVRESERERFSSGIDVRAGEELLRRDFQTAEMAVLRSTEFMGGTGHDGAASHPHCAT